MAEVVPVSSSAQLSLLPWLLRWEPPSDRTRFAAGLHAGSAVGVALALRHDLTRDQARRAALSSLPAAAAGLALGDVVERRLGRPGPTAALLAGAGLALWAADRRPSRAWLPRNRPRPAKPESAGVRGARDQAAADSSVATGWLAASIAQVVALAPGVSRTGATLTALRAAGVPREDALRTSLVMSLPVTLGAAGLTSLRARQLPAPVPTAVAGLTAYAAARRVRPTEALVTGSVIYRLAVAAAVARRLRKERR